MALTNQTSKKEVNQIFDGIANDYDKMNNLISLGMHDRWRKKANSKLDLVEGAQVLDVCCGTGDWSLSLAEMVGATGKVTGLDFSREMLKIAQQKIKAEQHKNITLIKGDAQQLPFPDDSFDACVIGFGLRNVPDAGLTLAEMRRVVKPGGKVIVLETSQPQKIVIRFGWKLYLEKIIPLMGSLIHQMSAYDYLQSSTQKFLTPLALDKLFLQQGYQKVQHQSLALGAAMIHTGEK